MAEWHWIITEWSLNGLWNAPAIQSTVRWLKRHWFASFSLNWIVAFRLVYFLLIWKLNGLLIVKTGDPDTKDRCVPRLFENKRVVIEITILIVNDVFAISVIYPIEKRNTSSQFIVWTHVSHLYTRVLCSKFGWKCYSCSWEEKV